MNKQPVVRAKSSAFRVHGNSMENPNGMPSYSDGDIIYVDPAVRPSNLNCVIVRHPDHGGLLFRQFVEDKGEKWLRALNAASPDAHMPVTGGLEFIGTVVGKGVPA